MKYAAAIMVAAALVAPAQASENDKDYVKAVVAAIETASRCDLNVQPDVAAKFADVNGVDQKVVAATYMALAARSGLDYDRALLIPEITEVVRDTSMALKKVFTTDPVRACQLLGNAAVDNGWAAVRK